MSPQGILYGHILSVLATIFGGLWVATQWVAAQFSYDPYLGPRWFSVLDTPVYYPWRLFEWWYAFHAYAPEIFRTGDKIVVGATFASILVAILLSVWRGRRAKKLTTFGSSEWASQRTMRRAGLLTKTGVFLGSHKKNYLRHSGPEHIMAFAPTRPGKGVGLVVPTLLSWAESAVIHDIKGENWRSPLAGGQPSLTVSCSIQPIRPVQNTIRCWKCAKAAMKSATFRTSRTFSSILKGRTKPLVRLILNQIGRRLTEKLDYETEAEKRRRVLLMLDEFPALGRLDFFESALAFMAGYGLRAFLIAQSLNQIEKAYGPNNSILDNCHVRVAFATNDERTARRISIVHGLATEMRAIRNYDGHRLAPWRGHVMVSRQESARQLLTPGEIMQLPPDDEVVLVSGYSPVRAKKLRYFQDQNFVSRVISPPALAGPNHSYGDRPSPRPDDWGQMTRPVDDRLFAANDEDAISDTGGKDLKRDIDAPQQEITKPAEHEQNVEPDDADGVAAKRAADLVRRAAIANKTYGLDRGTPDFDLLDF